MRPFSPEDEYRRDVVAKRWVLGGALTVLAAVVSAWAYFHFVYGMRPHDNPSFRYGEQVMVDRVYGPSYSGSLGDECRRAIVSDGRRPYRTDIDEAVSGCQYEEFILDN